MQTQEKFSYINCSNVETTVYFQEQKEEKMQINFKNYSKILIITEKIILIKYCSYLKSITSNMNSFFLFEVEQSDFHKNNSTKEKIDNFLLEKNFDTNSLIIGFGGGKVTDLAGFVASTFLRGVDLLLIPTTLLSMVDASIGGKTGINNLHYGKNLIGSFYNPKYIYINLWILEDLEEDLISDGMAEIIKMCLLRDYEMFKVLEQNNINSLRSNLKLFYEIVKKNILHKVNVIQIDAKDKNIRKMLNFGHTIGHAIESVESFNLSHGKCVSIGMIYELQLGIIFGITDELVLIRTKDTLNNYKLPLELPNYLDSFEIIEMIKYDKKRQNNKIFIVFIKEIGVVYDKIVFPVEESKVQELLSTSVKIDIPNQIDTDKIYEISLKGSKSICNRALILSALGTGSCLLRNFLFCEDTDVMIKCLRILGVNIEIIDKSTIKIEGRGGVFENIEACINVENSGTTARFLVSFCCLFRNSRIRIDGSLRMRERPIDDLLDALITGDNFSIEYESLQKSFPFTIITNEKGFKGGELSIKSDVSSQFVTSVLLSSAFYRETLQLTLVDVKEKNLPVSHQYITMTIEMMKNWGIKVERNHNLSFIKAENKPFNNPSSYYIEPDASTVNFYIAYIALHSGRLKINGLGKKSIQGDSSFVDILNKLGYKSEKGEDYIYFESERGLKEINRQFEEDVSLCTDSFLALGVLLSQHQGIFKLTGLRNQAMKECSRLEQFSLNMNKFGVYCYSFDDGVVINTNVRREISLHSITISSCNDHRMGMSFSILASYLNHKYVVLDNKSCVNKTYPEFWKDFNSVFGFNYSPLPFNFSKSEFKLNSKSYLNQPIFLIGMRSCGKTTFGRNAASKLGLNFLDLDEYLINKHKHVYESINQIIEKKGWKFFRQLERECYLEVFQNTNNFLNTIIATGGGIVENEELLENLKANELVIFIDTDLKNILEICKMKEMKKGLETFDYNKPNFDKSIEEIYYSRLNKYQFINSFVFKTPFINMDLMNNLNQTIELISNNLSDFIFLNCAPMKFPLPQEDSFVTGMIIKEDYKDIFNLNNLKDIFTNFPKEYSCFEVRLDFIVNKLIQQKTPVNSIVDEIINIVSQIRLYVQIPIILTLRTEIEGGHLIIEKGNFKTYNQILTSLVKYGMEFIDVEYHEDNISFIANFLKMAKNSRIILSKHFKNCSIEEIEKIVYNMNNLKIDVITNIQDQSDYITFLKFKMNYLSKHPIIHFQMNEQDKYTRLLNTYMNFVYVPELSGPFAKGQMTRKESIEIRQLLNYKTNVNQYYVIGNLVSKSPSPLLHKSAFEYLNSYSSSKYSFGHLNIDNNDEFIKFIQNKTNLKIASITIPFKETIFNLVKNSSEECKYINCANTLNKVNDNYYIYNTDFLAAYEILLEIFSNLNKSHPNILIIGSGGASLGVILALKLFNLSEIYVYNRTYEKCVKVCEKYNLKIFSVEELKNKLFDVVISTIPGKTEFSFFEDFKKFLDQNTFLVDLAYIIDGKTSFYNAFISNSKSYYDGLTFLIRQAVYQSCLFTGKIVNRKNYPKLI